MDGRFVQRSEQEGTSLLSPREHQLLVLAAKGFTDQGIAHKLGISLATVGTYWGRIRIKMGPLNRTELVAHFLQEEAAHEVDSLRNENQRLLTELSQQSQAEEALRASLEMFRGLIDSAPDAIIVVNQDGGIVLANEQAARMFGYSQDELANKRVDFLIPTRFRLKHMEHRGEYLANPTKRRMGEHLATLALRRDGTEFTMATALSATKVGNDTLVTCIIRDLSERMEERAMARVGSEEE